VNATGARLAGLVAIDLDQFMERTMAHAARPLALVTGASSGIGGEGDVAAGLKNKLQVAAASNAPLVLCFSLAFSPFSEVAH
jgi:hypothetical protein